MKTRHGENGNLAFFCPGCKHCHAIPAEQWHWNGDRDAPTLSPSVRHFYERKGRRVTTCHYFLRQGVLLFCGDCQHELAGQKVPLEDIPEGH